jgi:hypothetical protein
MKKWIVVLMFVGLACTQSYAQHKISVKVTDAGGQPLPYTTVLLKHVKDSVLVKGELSAADGGCAFDQIGQGQYFLQVSLMGYTPYNSANFTLDGGQSPLKLPAIALKQSSKSLQGVTVTAQRPFIERKEGATVLNVESSVAATGGNALDVLKRAPGVQIDQDDNVLLKGSAGVTIMIDGKLTYLSGEQLSNLLKSLPAETISQIEIITSPSAKYDAAGNSGIINIKTKKGTLTGVNGTLNAGIGEGHYPIYNLGGNVNWRTKQFNAFATYNYANRQFFNRRQLLHWVHDNDTIQTLDSRVYAARQFISNNFKAGVDYFLTPKQTLGVMVQGFRNQFMGRENNFTYISTMDVPDSTLHTGTHVHNHYDGTTYDLNYKAELDSLGKEFTLDGTLVKDHFVRDIHLNDTMSYPAKPGVSDPHGVRNNTLTNITIKSLKADLVLPFNKDTKLEAGVKGSWVTTDNILAYDSLVGGKYENAITQSNEFIYTENVYAAYGLFKKNFKHDNFQLGLRLENTQSDGYSVTLQSRVKRNYTDLFPTVSAEHIFPDSNKVGISYSRRISRPDYDDLNPFIWFIDKYTYGRGNPYLKPQYSNIIELSYTFKQKYIAAFNYRVINGVMMEYLDQDTVTKIVTSYERNYQQNIAYSLALTIPVDPFKWWNITNNINVNYNYYKLKDSTLNLGNASIVAVEYNTTHTFTLPNNWKAEITAYYNSPHVWGVFHARSQSNISIGVQKAVMDKKLTLKLNVNDVFNQEQFIGRVKYNGLDMYIHNRWQNQSVNFSVAWNFGNSNIKGAADKEATDEQRRAGN